MLVRPKSLLSLGSAGASSPSVDRRTSLAAFLRLPGGPKLTALHLHVKAGRAWHTEGQTPRLLKALVAGESTTHACSQALCQWPGSESGSKVEGRVKTARPRASDRGQDNSTPGRGSWADRPYLLSSCLPGQQIIKSESFKDDRTLGLTTVLLCPKPRCRRWPTSEPSRSRWRSRRRTVCFVLRACTSASVCRGCWRHARRCDACTFTLNTARPARARSNTIGTGEMRVLGHHASCGRMHVTPSLPVWRCRMRVINKSGCSSHNARVTELRARRTSATFAACGAGPAGGRTCSEVARPGARWRPAREIA